MSYRKRESQSPLVKLRHEKNYMLFILEFMHRDHNFKKIETSGDHEPNT